MELRVVDAGLLEPFQHSLATRTHNKPVSAWESVPQRSMAMREPKSRAFAIANSEGCLNLKLIHRLCQELKAEDVIYCHWKRNIALDRSAAGDNGLDLLISRADMQRFVQILHLLGFKEARAPLELQLPGVLDYYGYDSEADKFAHVDAHYQLMLGHDRTKNYRLPIEEPFLLSATQDGLFKIPAPAFELIVFVIRMTLKYSAWDVLLFGQGTLPSAALQELGYLQSQVSAEQIHDTLKHDFPYIDVGLFDACVASLRQDSSVWNRININRQLQTQLRAHARRPRPVDVYLKLWRRATTGVRRRVLKHLPRKRLAGGGAMIALVGGDGAGKSTATDNLYTWLSKNFDTVKIHMGRPPQSWTTNVVRGALKIARLLTEFRDRRSSLSVGTAANSPELPDYSQLLRYVCLARDRYRAYVKARRFATNGGIVICDRFPLPEIKLMDSPRLERLVDRRKNNRLIRFLVRLEKSWYSSLGHPDVLIVLTVDPEIAVARKTDEDAASVRTRATEMWQLDWQTTRAHVIDADQPAADVLAELKSLVWSQV